MVDTTVIYDLSGLRCPLPLLKTQKKKKSLSPNVRLVVLSDDPLAPLDITHYCRQNGFSVEVEDKDGVYHISII
ncbi:sulfurtransferase TusA family protein [Bartonella sp. LJL80]